MDRLFVQIASYRDTLCQSTIDHLFAQAAVPERVFVGLCLQEPADTPEPSTPAGIDAAQLRVARCDYTKSEGVCWARSIAQQLWQGEEYVLSLDSHTRLVQGWDDLLIAELLACPAEKPVVTTRPATFEPPDLLEPDAVPTRLTVFAPAADIEVKIVAERLSFKPEQPLPNPFVAAGFLFARSSLITEIPYDPQMYFDYEELSLALRLYTHGYDCFIPRHVIAYHYFYNAQASPQPYRLHWEDCAEWTVFQARGVRRFKEIILTAALPESVVVDRHGIGRKRTLQAFEAATRLRLSHDGPVLVRMKDGEIPTIVPPNTRSVATSPDAVVRINKPVFGVSTVDRFAREAIVAAPHGVLIMHDYLSVQACATLRAYADSQSFQRMSVLERNDAGEQHHTRVSDQRITDSIDIGGVAFEMVNLFNDIYCNRLAPYYNVRFARYERPGILRYLAGGRYNAHADADDYVMATRSWTRILQRDFSVLLYLNDDYDGGELDFPGFGYRFKPQAGMLVAFPSDHRYMHAALPTTSGIRYAIVSFGTVVNSPPAPGKIDCRYIELC